MSKLSTDVFESKEQDFDVQPVVISPDTQSSIVTAVSVKCIVYEKLREVSIELSAESLYRISWEMVFMH